MALQREMVQSKCLIFKMSHLYMRPNLASRQTDYSNYFLLSLPIVMPTLSALHYFWSSIYSVIISNIFDVSDINLNTMNHDYSD